MASSARRRVAAVAKVAAFAVVGLGLAGVPGTHRAWVRADTYRCLRHTALVAVAIESPPPGAPTSVGDAVDRCTLVSATGD